MTSELQTLRENIRLALMDTRIVKTLFGGAFDSAGYTRYLQNVYCYAQHSPVVMAMAAARCTGSHPELSSYLLHHAQEELGHDRWAFDDLRDLGLSEDEILALQPTPACEAMIAHMYYTAGHANPIGLFGWMYVLEAVGSDLGGMVAQQLAKVSVGGPATQHRFVARHGVTDVGHTEELAEQITRFVTAPEDYEAVVRVGQIVVGVYSRIFREVGGETEQWV